MTEQKLAENNFLSYAIKNYDNPTIGDLVEFDDDLKRFIHLSKLLKRYKLSLNINELKERLILNHIIIIYNLWSKHATNMLFFKIGEEYWNVLIPFLAYLGRLPEFVPNTNIRITSLPIDENVQKKLREI
jgi:hypothetical protein